jgi:hypothetical protein
MKAPAVIAGLSLNLLIPDPQTHAPSLSSAMPRTKKADLSVNQFVVFGGAEGEISRASLPQGASPLWRLMNPACDPRIMMEVLPSNSLGSIPLI